ncbi:hypothetical protein ACNVED_11570 [Legionella sp. D16C41]|uniref:hypothetical protein n=1 Tax=Legionella sp. D16C41 TaxID=3402688 RepID=UPI003AF41D60
MSGIYRQWIREIITTFPQIDGSNPLFEFCLELIDDSHRSPITLEWFANHLTTMVLEQKALPNNDYRRQLFLENTLNWLKDNNNQVAIPPALFNLLLNDNYLEPVVEREHFAIELKRLKEATTELVSKQHLILFSNLDAYQAAQSLKKIVDTYLPSRKKNVTENKINEYKNSYLPFFQKSYQQKEQAFNALTEALNGIPVDLLSHLETLREDNLGKALRAFIKNGQANVIVGKDVHTVTEFINELHKQVNPSVILQVSNK